jgi:hypothetical protein
MKALSIAALLPPLLLCAACGDVTQDLGRRADSTRRAAEHVAASSQAASRAREDQIFEQARLMQEQASASTRAALGIEQAQRYEMRKEGAGWVVYDAATGRPARIAGKPQSGLTESRAYDAYQQLRGAESGDDFLARRPGGP